MNDEYLWDKSGKPDPEIQQLEQILGALRYQPKPLTLPDPIPIVDRNHRVPIIAIAATLLVALLAGGLWLIATKRPVEDRNAVKLAPLPSPELPPIRPNESAPIKTEAASAPKPNNVATNSRRVRRATVPTLTTREREQAVEAKQQLMMALKVASEKLNLAQRKTQGPSPNQIRNQHKVG